MTPSPTAVAPPTPPVRVRSTRDLLSVVPYALGYQPAECLLVVCVRHDGDLGLVARTDLDDVRASRARAEVADLVATRAAEDSTAVAYVIAYTAAEPRPGSTAVAAARAFAAALDGAVPGCESWLVGTERYWCLDCTNPECCPLDGFPLATLESTIPGAELVLEGHAPLPTREALYRVPRATPGRRALVRRAADRWARARAHGHQTADADATSGAPGPVAPAASSAGGGPDAGRLTAQEWRVRSYESWLDAVSKARRGYDLPAALLGRLAAGLEDREMRDGVLLSFISGYEALAASTAAGGPRGADARAQADARTSEAIAAVVDCETALRPERAHVQAATLVLEAVVAHATRARAVSPLTLLAFLAWWSGEGSRAAFRTAEALAADPSHRLASLLSSALSAGLPPGWVRSRSNADVSGGQSLDLG